MVNIILIGLLLFGLFMGMKRGFILQVFHLLGYIASFVVATLYYDKLVPYLKFWIPYPEISDPSTVISFLQALPLESAFYNAISFAIIFFATKVILHIVASMLDFVADLPILSWFNTIFGAVLGFLEVYLISFVILNIMILLPVASIQSLIGDSSIALLMIEHTPILSEKIGSLWFTQIESLFN